MFTAILLFNHKNKKEVSANIIDHLKNLVNTWMWTTNINLISEAKQMLEIRFVAGKLDE